MEYIYAALLLHKTEQPVNEENLKKVIEATGAKVDDSKIKTLIASLQGVDIGVELENASVAVATVAESDSGAAGGEAKAEEKKEKKEDAVESAAGLASLFG